MNVVAAEERFYSNEMTVEFGSKKKDETPDEIYFSEGELQMLRDVADRPYNKEIGEEFNFS